MLLWCFFFFKQKTAYEIRISDWSSDVCSSNLAMAMMDLEGERLVTAYQVHSPEVVEVRQPWAREDAPKADAMVTRERGLALGILTADCVPVLFAEAGAGVVGAAHAGWNGALTGVIEGTIAAMAPLGAQPS